MLGPEETLALTGHPVGGVCPFGLATPIAGLSRRVAAGVRHRLSGGGLAQHLGRVTPDRLFELVGERWVDACRLPEEAAGA